MAIDVTVSGLNTEVNVTREEITNIDPDFLLALRGEKGDKGDDGIVGRDGTDGSDGVGITSITQNQDGTLSINLDDGTSYLTEPLKGADGYTPVKGVDYFDGTNGQDGKDGVDGYTPVKGVDYFDGVNGEDGEDGVGIASITKTGSLGLVDTYTITLTNSSTATFTVTNGVAGAKGDTGATGNGISSAVLNSDYTLTLTFTDGTSYTTSSIRGEKGEKGEKGDAGDVDTAMSSTSTLPVQNRVIKSYVDSGLSGKANTSHNHTVSQITDFPSLATVATSGSYEDLSDKPTIPTDTTYTLTKSGNTITLTGSDGSTTSVTDSNTTYGAMSQAQATAGTSTSARLISPKVLHDTIHNALPTVPSALSELTNDMTVSDFTNDAGYITGYTETDPVFSTSAAYGITTTDIDHWDSGLIEFDTSAASGDDYNLATALTAMGWLSDVIV